jgi:hypothetical protein
MKRYNLKSNSYLANKQVRDLSILFIEDIDTENDILSEFYKFKGKFIYDYVLINFGNYKGSNLAEKLKHHVNINENFVGLDYIACLMFGLDPYERPRKAFYYENTIEDFIKQLNSIYYYISEN